MDTVLVGTLDAFTLALSLIHQTIEMHAFTHTGKYMLCRQWSNNNVDCQIFSLIRVCRLAQILCLAKVIFIFDPLLNILSLTDTV